MSKFERAIGGILVILIEIFMIPILLPIVGNFSWVLIISAIIFPILIFWKGDVLKEIDYGR
jgi:hypothetical protein